MFPLNDNDNPVLLFSLMPDVRPRQRHLALIKLYRGTIIAFLKQQLMTIFFSHTLLPITR